MSIPFPEPTLPAASRTAVLLGYLDYFRSVLRSKLAGLDEAALRGSVLPSGGPVETLDGLLAELDRRAGTTTAIAGRHDLAETGVPGDRWDGAEPATLERVLLHLVQEYARHCGHLDVVRELLDGTVGES